MVIGPTSKVVTLLGFLDKETTAHKYVNYDHPGECSPEKDCLW